MKNGRTKDEVNYLKGSVNSTLTKEVAYLLFKQGDIPNTLDGEPAFTWLMKNNIALLEEITSKASKDELNDFLKIAVRINDKKGTKYLLEKGAEANCDNDICICVACKLGHCKIVKLLLNAGANPDAEDGYPITVAAEKGHYKIVKALIEANANVKVNRNYPIKIANIKKNFKIVVLLEENGADLDL